MQRKIQREEFFMSCTRLGEGRIYFPKIIPMRITHAGSSKSKSTS
jgi:hypothetical protein